jgi:hypothetical protein
MKVLTPPVDPLELELEELELELEELELELEELELEELELDELEELELEELELLGSVSLVAPPPQATNKDAHIQALTKLNVFKTNSPDA